jgi:hypothetical protein
MIVGGTCHRVYPNVSQKTRAEIERKRYIGVQLVQMERMHYSIPPIGIMARCVCPRSFFPLGTYWDIIQAREGAGPDRVYDWSKNFAASQTKITFGPNGSFFRIAGETSGYLTEGLPSGLEQLAKDDDGWPISGVALGANGHYEH